MSGQAGLQPRADVGAVLLAVVGGLVLLPGLFSIAVCIAAAIRDPRVLATPFAQTLAVFMTLGLGASLAGLWLLWYARRRWHRRREETPGR